MASSALLDFITVVQFAYFLKIAQNKKYANCTTVIKSSNAEDAINCDIVYITNFFSEKIKDVNKIIGTLPVLTITQKPDYSNYNACISFFIDDDLKTKFQLNRLLNESKKLTISNQLKSLSVVVN